MQTLLIAKLRYPLKTLSHFCDIVNMATMRVLLFAEHDRGSPFLRWVESLPAAAQDKCIVRVEWLEEAGDALCDSECAEIRGGVHQLSFRSNDVEYAILYFFNNKEAVIVHGCTAASRIADAELAIALDRKLLFSLQPNRHTYREEE